MKIRRKYSKEIELNCCKLYNEGISTKECSEMLKISQSQINRYLKRNNVKIRDRSECQGISKEKEILILQDYLNKFKAISICKKYNICHPTLMRIIKSKGFKAKKGTEVNKKYSCNEDYFENIDSLDKAYFLGLIVADGNVIKRTLEIALQEGDSYILQIFKNLIKSNHPIKLRKKKKETHFNMKRLSIVSEKMVNDLSKYGVIPNKSFKTYFPEIPEEFYSHFIRGVFDGDGCIWKGTKNTKIFNICGNTDLVKKIQEILVKNLQISCTKINNNTKTNKHFVSFTNAKKEDIEKIYKYLYRDCKYLYLKRKKQKFEE